MLQGEGGLAVPGKNVPTLTLDAPVGLALLGQHA